MTTDTLAALNERLRHANDLPDWALRATQPVFGEGPIGAPLFLLGEQPGDEEDIAGRPFVGPAGRLLDRALERAGVDRRAAYVTNAVKHFRFKPAGKRRLHQTPDAGDITYYRPFLIQELALVGPRLVVAMGGTALRAAVGRALPVLKTRRQVVRSPEGWDVFGTLHPSALLRLRDAAERNSAFSEFADDLRLASAWSRRGPG